MDDDDLPDEIEEALKSAGSWLERWAAHVGNCRGADACSCGLSRVRYDVAVALAKFSDGAEESV